MMSRSVSGTIYTGLVIGFSILFLCLCSWQLTKFIQTKSGTGTKPPPVTLTGTFDPASIVLLNNQFHEHKAGFHVLQLFQPNDGQQVILVNRGWVSRLPGSIDKLTKTDISTIVGRVFQPRRVFHLGPITAENLQGIKRIQYIDLTAIGKILDREIAPVMLKLDPAQAACFACDWKPVYLTPERHLAYAVQWFGLASVVLIGFFLTRRSVAGV